MTNLTELKKLAEAATPGPWETNKNDIISSDIEVVASDGFVSVADCSPYDALYIAAANPQAILQMIAVIEQMKVALETIADSDNWGEDGCWNSSSYPDEIAEDCLAAYSELTA
jgi:hypothetical protein